jgi:glycerol-3-phosphate dehydrogenase
MRPEALDRLDGGSFDLLVVGAGIVGSRVAYEAARHGLRVALVEARDFGGATSSASSKLVHGGLRYLSSGDLPLVRHLQAERAVLMRSVAPHLVRPLPLLVVVERQHPRRAAKLAAGLAIYAALDGACGPRPRLLRPARARDLVPALDPHGVSACGLVSEAQTHDARLTLATVRGAARAGALVLNYVELVGLERAAGRLRGARLRDVVRGDELTLRCRAVVNATGAAVDSVRRLECGSASPFTRLSRGVHALLPLEEGWSAGVALFDETRSALAVPWYGMLLVGATDVEVDGDGCDGPPQPFEIDAVLAPLADVLRAGTLRSDRVVHATAGLRVLPRGPGDTSRASRRHLIDVGPAGMVSLAGGKLTTHRAIAVDALRRLPVEVRPHRAASSNAPLPGAGTVGPLRGVEPDVAAHLVSLYGAEAGRVLGYGGRARIHADGPDLVAQVRFARDEEWALTVDDVVCRRTTLAVRGLADESVRHDVAMVLAEQGKPSRRSRERTLTA